MAGNIGVIFCIRGGCGPLATIATRLLQRLRREGTHLKLRQDPWSWTKRGVGGESSSLSSSAPAPCRRLVSSRGSSGPTSPPLGPYRSASSLLAGNGCAIGASSRFRQLSAHLICPSFNGAYPVATEGPRCEMVGALKLVNRQMMKGKMCFERQKMQRRSQTSCFRSLRGSTL